MLRYLIIILCLNFSLAALSQPDEELSSLYSRAKEHAVSQAYLDICYYFIDHNSPCEEFLIYLDKGYKAALEERNAESIGTYYSLRGDYYLLKGDNDKFLRDRMKSAAIFQKLNNVGCYIDCLGQLSYFYLLVHKPDSARYFIRKGLAMLDSPENDYTAGLLHNLSVSYMDEGKQDSAIYYAQKATDAAILNKDSSFLMNSYIQQGVICRKQDKLPLALDFYEKALDIAERLDCYTDASVLYSNVAYLYAGMERKKEALNMAEKAVQTANMEGDNLMIANAYITKGGILYKMNDSRNAVTCLRQALHYFDGEEHPRFFLKVTNYLTPAYLHLNKVDSARYYQSKAAELYTQLPPYSTETRDYYASLMQLYHHSGEYFAMLQTADKLDEIYKKNPDKGFMPFFYKLKAEAFSKTGNPSQAYLYMTKAYASHDSVLNREHSLQLSDFMVKYRTKEKELQIFLLQQQQIEQETVAMRRMHRLLFALFILLSLVLFLLYNRQRQKAKSARLASFAKEKEREFIALQKDTEHRLTRNYIDGLESERERLSKELHDGVCNNLLALEMDLKTLPDENKDEKLKKSISLLTQIRESVRNVSHELMPPVFQYATIDEMLYDYTTHLDESGIIELRYFSTEDVDWSLIPQQIGFEIYRIVQEALNNCLKHASASCIEVSMLWKGNLLTVRIADNGMGFDTNKKQKGIGLRTIAERVKSIGGELLIQTGDGGTDILVTINIRQTNEE